MQMEILQKIIKYKNYDLFSRKYSQIYKNLNIEVFHTLVGKNETDFCIFLKTLEIILIFKNKKYLEVISYIENNIKGLLLGKVRSYDICISKILRLYYLARKELGMNNDIFFNLMVPNKELGNVESVSVITNCLLDYLISNNIYKRVNTNEINNSNILDNKECNNILDNNSDILDNKECNNSEIVQSEIHRNNFYNGIIEIIEGNYDKAYSLFNSSIVKRSSKIYLILSSLLQSKYNFKIPYDKKISKYFELSKIVKGADLQAYMKFIDQYKEDLIKENTYFLVLRLSRNVIQEKIRCISLIYSKISYDDMCSKLNMDKEDLEYILLKSINLGLVNGEVKDNIYYTCKDKKKFNKRYQFENIKNINKLIKSEMIYPEILPLCYEKVKE